MVFSVYVSDSVHLLYISIPHRLCKSCLCHASFSLPLDFSVLISMVLQWYKTDISTLKLSFLIYYHYIRYKKFFFFTVNLSLVCKT